MIKFPPRAINCFTGSLAQMSSRCGVEIEEAQLLEAGDGYLYRAGLDEFGLPEYTFAVEDVGLRACAVLGARVMRIPIGVDWLTQLTTILVDHPCIVWVNSAYLDYAPIYSTRPGYLHAVLVIGINDAATHVRIIDSLIVDREPYGCEAWLTIDAFASAILNRVRTEAYDHMGNFIVMQTPPTDALFDTRTSLHRQAELYYANDVHSNALPNYRSLCMQVFSDTPTVASAAARRLFDHIVVLYVIPGLSLLSHSTRRAGCGESLNADISALIDHWRALSILALKFEATASLVVLRRIEERFGVLESSVHGMWMRIHNATRR